MGEGNGEIAVRMQGRGGGVGQVGGRGQDAGMERGLMNVPILLVASRYGFR